jgi:uncharacterized protein (DUF1697 family)
VTRYAAFLRGVNLGRRTVKSAELRAALEDLGMSDVRTLISSGNALFDARPSRSLKQKLEAGLSEHFGFPIKVVLRAIEDLRAMVAADPFGGEVEHEGQKLHVMLFDETLPEGFALAGVAGDFAVPRIAEREIFIIAFRKPNGTYLADSVLAIDKALPRGTLVTARNWNTILKAIA